MATTFEDARLKMQNAGFSSQEIARVANLYNNNQVDQAKKLITTTLAKYKPATQAPIVQPQMSATVNPASVIAGGATINANTSGTQGKTNASGNISQVSTAPQTTSVTPEINKYGTTVDIGNVSAMRAAQTPEEKAWQAKQDAFDAGRSPTPTQTPKTEPTTPSTTTEAGKVSGTSQEYDKYTQIIKDAMSQGRNFEEARQVANEAFGTNKDQRNYEILANLQQGYANAPQLFSNFSTFKQAYGYEQKPENEKRVLEAFFKNKGGVIPGQQPTGQEIKARNAQSDFQRYSGMNSGEIADSLKNGEINVGDDLYNALLQSNPQLIKDAENINTLNAVYGKPTPTTVVETNVSDKLTKGMTQADVPNYKKMLSEDANVSTSLDRARQTKTSIDEITSALETLEDDVRSQYKGSTEGVIQALIAEKQKPLLIKMSKLQRQYSNEMSDVEYYSGLVKDDYENQKSEFDYAKKQQDTIAAEERAFARQQALSQQGFTQSKEMAAYQQNLSIAGKQKQFEMEMEQQAKMASDPVLATQQVIDQYRKMGVLAQRSDAEIIQAVQNDIKGGMSLGQSLTNLNKAFQSKPEYKALTTEKPTAQPQVWAKLDDTTVYNQATGETKTVKPGTPVTSADISNYTTTRNGSENIQCGALVNDYWKDATGNTAGMGDTLSSKYNAIVKIGESPTPKVGGLFISNPLNNNVGHTGIVSSINPDGSITVREANAQGKPNGQPPITKTYTAEQLAGMKFSVAPTIKTSPVDKNPVNKLAEYIIDTQPRGQGFSDADAKAFTETVKKYADAGDSEMVIQLMRNKMLENKNIGDTIYTNADLKAGLNNLQSLLTEYKNSGGNTNILSSIAETVANKLGTTTNTELAKAKNQLGVLVADYIRAISGTAASDAEVQRLISNMPQIKNIDSFNMSLLDNLGNIADRRAITRIETYLGKNKQYAPELFPEFYTRKTNTTQNQTSSYTTPSGNTYNLNDYR